MNTHEDKNDEYFEFPEEYSRRQLNALYREIPLKDTASRMLRKYFNAMANLYGVIRLGDAYELISRQSPTLVTQEEFLAFAEIARHECEDYFILGLDELFNDCTTDSPLDREIIDCSLMEEDLAPYVRVREMQKGKPYYLPPKKELLCYADLDYFELTPELVQMSMFFSRYPQLDDMKRTLLLEDIQFEIKRWGADLTDLLPRMQLDGMTFAGKAELQEFVDLFRQLHNATRMQCNRGYTPDELMRMRPAGSNSPTTLTLGPNIRKAIADGTLDAEQLRREIQAAEGPSDALKSSLLSEIEDAARGQVKPTAPSPKSPVGRNAPCPCGSGKKYKKCCGRSAG